MQNDGGRRPRANYETTRQPEVAGLRPETGDGSLRRPIDRGLKDEAPEPAAAGVDSVRSPVDRGQTKRRFEGGDRPQPNAEELQNTA